MGARYFFEIDNMIGGERKDIKLIYNNIAYDGHFKLESQKTSRTYLFWNSDFRDILKQELPEFYDLFNKEQDTEHIELPKIRFEKIDQYNFNIEFIILHDIQEDMESEKVESSSEFNDPIEGARTEGKVKYTYGKKYERDPKNRAAAIAYQGTKCKICGFDFEEYYGCRGKGYIEIHHINPLSNIGEEVKIDPKVDLIPVCANCHRMIHRRKDKILSIEQMKEIVNKNKSK